MDTNINTRVTTTSAAVKRLTTRGCNVLRSIANDGLGVEAGAGTAVASLFEEYLNNGIDEGGRVATELLRRGVATEWLRSGVESAFAFVSLSKENGSQGEPCGNNVWPVGQPLAEDRMQR